MSTGTIFGICIALGILIAQMLDQSFIEEGLFLGIVAGALIVRIKNKRHDKK